MPDIFGREQHEYQHYAAMGKELAERHMAAHAMRLTEQVGTPATLRHNFNALGTIQERTAVNAQAIGYVDGQSVGHHRNGRRNPLHGLSGR